MTTVFSLVLYQHVCHLKYSNYVRNEVTLSGQTVEVSCSQTHICKSYIRSLHIVQKGLWIIPSKTDTMLLGDSNSIINMDSINLSL